MNKYQRLFSSIFILYVASDFSTICYGISTPNTAPPSSLQPKSMPTLSPTSVNSSEHAYMSYNYHGDYYRDPFIPLLGETHVDENGDRPPQINTLTLKGIVEDMKGKMAILAAGNNSYILRGGRLYDSKNRMIKGVSGVIKSDRVLMIGSDHTMREIHREKGG